MKSFEELGTEYSFTDRGDMFTLEIAEEDSLLIEMPEDACSAAAAFDHPNLLARRCQLLQSKHGGLQKRMGLQRKWWTRRAGVGLYFEVPKKRILFEDERTLSYVTVQINGESITLSVTGGGSGRDGWRDIVCQGSHSYAGYPLRTVRSVAEVSVEPAKASKFVINDMNPEDRKGWISLATKATISGKLNAGSRLVLERDDQEDRERVVLRRPKRARHFVTAGYGEVYYDEIDWLATAAANGMEIITPESFNRAGDVIERDAA